MTPAAERALKEAEERRKAREREESGAPPEVGGRKGPDPGALRRLGEGRHRLGFLIAAHDAG